MQRISRFVALAVVLAVPASPVLAGGLKLSLANGRATVIADNVTVREILAEWARVGRTTIVNGDKITGPAVTLQLIDVPEAQALDTILRSASGYVVAQRAVYAPGASVFDRILIMPTSRPPAVSAIAPPPAFNPRQMSPIQQADDDEPMDAPVVLPPGVLGPPQNPNNPNLRIPGPNDPNPNPANQQPFTAPRPGLMPPTGQPNPNSTVPPVRRPGGPGGEGL